MKITQILEARQEVVTIPWDDEDTTAAPQKSAVSTDKPASTGALGKVASPLATREKAANVQLPDSAMTRLQGFMKKHGQAADAEAEQGVGTDQGDEEVTARDVPVIISAGMKEAGIVTPEFHLIGNLPGQMVHAIRKLGRAIFAEYTTTPVDEIQMIANLGGQGPNTATEVNSVAKWVHEMGDEVTSGEIDFEESMPGYKADVRVYDVQGVQVMLVKDEYGTYVYAYPADSSKLDHDRNDVLLPR